MAFQQAGLHEVEVREGNVVRGKLEKLPHKKEANFVQVLGPQPNTSITVKAVEESRGRTFTKTRTFTETRTGGESMNTQVGLENIIKADKADLVYVICQLIEAGKATVAGVGALIAARTARIKALETELKRLKTEGVAGGQFWQFTLNKTFAAPEAAGPKTTAFRFGSKWRQVDEQEAKTLAERMGLEATAKTATPPKFDPKLSGRFNALVQHRCKTPQAKVYWQTLAKKIGLAEATARLLEATACKQPPVPRPAPKAKPTISNARKEFLHQQGLYLGYLRHVNGVQKNRIKSIAKKQGIPAAVKELLKLRKGR